MAAPPLPQAPVRCLRHLASLLLPMVFFSNMVLSQHVIENLPGFPGKLPFTLETGYIGVGEKEEVQLFYYFVESESNPEDDPLMLWLTGGPGCSGLSGLVYEIGPFTIDNANSNGSIPALILNKYSWTKVANIIFLDQPVGTGFSYANTSGASYSNDTLSATHTYDFLRKWLISHPKYLENPLYICGDSYSGIFVSLLVNEVYNGIEAGIKPMMNMKGYMLGNPFVDAFADVNARIPYAHRMGLLSDGLYQSTKVHCHGNYMYVDPDNVLCLSDLERVEQCLEKICTSQILEPSCGGLWRWKRDVLSWKMPSFVENPIDFLQPIAPTTKSWCRDTTYLFSHTWANDKSVQKALHIREETITEWVRCNHSIQHNEVGPDGTIPYINNVQSVVHYHQDFTNKSCRALIYSGDHDMSIPHTSTTKWIDSLKLPIQSDWRPWSVEGQIAGYTMTYGHSDYELTFATVKGAGHTAPEYKPAECFAMLNSWLSQSPL
ncbi:hypothetical protein Pfo_000776 [Paulownia fortunei]|nr:hypothetical protein Pfo_000776 [Paulownia fortunei]